MSHDETATAAKRLIKPPANRLFMTSEQSRREAQLRKWERDFRIDELDGLIRRHRSDKNYAVSVHAWRREKPGFARAVLTQRTKLKMIHPRSARND
jgi:hypothetical protein